MDFVNPGGHFISGTPINDIHILGAQTERGSWQKSIATLPAPITATFFRIAIGVAYFVLKAFIRLTRVRYSFAEYTPFRFSLGLP